MVLGVIYYGGLLLVLALISFQLLADVLPNGIAVRVGHNSEGYLAALVAAAWIQFVRPRLTDRRAEWPVTAAAGVILIVIGLLLIASDLPSRFATLNEAFLALGALLPYLQARRPLRRMLAAGIAVVLFVGVVTFESTAVVTDVAETFGILILAPIGFDLVDRGILDSEAVTSPRARWSWYGVLVLLPIVLTVLQHKAGLSGLSGTVVRYGVRVTESFVCMVLLHLYLAVGLGRTGQSRSTAAHRAPAAVARP